MKKILLVILIGMTVLVLAGPTAALAQGECINGLCGTPPPPSWPGSGCPCFFCDCGLWGKTDQGETYRYSVTYDGDGIEDDFNNCAQDNDNYSFLNIEDKQGIADSFRSPGGLSNGVKAMW
ncbi:MAG: hypothetical protein ACC630_04910 [Nitrospinota bacterium]